MPVTTRSWIALLASMTMASAVLAQDPPTDPRDIDPAVDTSARTLEPAVDTSAPPPRDDPAPATPAPSAATAPGASADPAANTSATPNEAAAPAAGARPATRGRALDRLELDATQITGNRELPKVLYIVPWKRADLGDLVGKPVNSLLDEVLTPVDRDVFRRENRYYRALQPDAARASGAAAAPAAQDER